MLQKFLLFAKYKKFYMKMQKLVLTEKREIRGAQKLENIRNKIECGYLSYAGWLCVLEGRSVGLRHGSSNGSVTA
jgi:hypothetical protein